MYFIRLFAKPMLLAVFFLSMHADAEQLLVIPASESGVSAPSANDAERQAVVPGYFKPASSATKLSPAEVETRGALWPLLLGGVGLVLVFFWLGRRSGASSVSLDAPSRVASALRAKLAIARVPQEGGAASKEAKHWLPLDQATTVTVDELSSVEEEAEVFLLLGRMDMAIGVLRHHVEANDDAPAHIWMSLLDVLHAQGLRQEFGKLATEIRERFNVVQPTWEGANARSHELTGLEHFPHLFAKITSHWNSPDCRDYLRSLTQDNRNGERGGFHVEAFHEILVLIGVLEYREKLASLSVRV